MAENEAEIISISQQSSLLECCMCGDSGLTNELFQCKICHFRSQHRYCSNLYPKAEFYKVCNWCLNQKEDSKDQKSQNSSNSSATCKDNSEEDESKKRKKKKVENDHNQGVANAGLKGNSQRNDDLKRQMMKKYPIKSSPEKSPRKRIINNARLEKKLRRTKSEEISNSGFITRHVFRNKVRRYKLLEEVSS